MGMLSQWLKVLYHRVKGSQSITKANVLHSLLTFGPIIGCGIYATSDRNEKGPDITCPSEERNVLESTEATTTTSAATVRTKTTSAETQSPPPSPPPPPTTTTTTSSLTLQPNLTSTILSLTSSLPSARTLITNAKYLNTESSLPPHYSSPLSYLLECCVEDIETATHPSSPSPPPTPSAATIATITSTTTTTTTTTPAAVTTTIAVPEKSTSAETVRNADLTTITSPPRPVRRIPLSTTTAKITTESATEAASSIATGTISLKTSNEETQKFPSSTPLSSSPSTPSALSHQTKTATTSKKEEHHTITNKTTDDSPLCIIDPSNRETIKHFGSSFHDNKPHTTKTNNDPCENLNTLKITDILHDIGPLPKRGWDTLVTPSYNQDDLNPAPDLIPKRNIDDEATSSSAGIGGYSWFGNVALPGAIVEEKADQEATGQATVLNGFAVLPGQTHSLLIHPELLST